MASINSQNINVAFYFASRRGVVARASVRFDVPQAAIKTQAINLSDYEGVPAAAVEIGWVGDFVAALNTDAAIHEAMLFITPNLATRIFETQKWVKKGMSVEAAAAKVAGHMNRKNSEGNKRYTDAEEKLIAKALSSTVQKYLALRAGKDVRIAKSTTPRAWELNGAECIDAGVVDGQVLVFENSQADADGKPVTCVDHSYLSGEQTVTVYENNGFKRFYCNHKMSQNELVVAGRVEELEAAGMKASLYTAVDALLPKAVEVTGVESVDEASAY